MKCEAIWHSRIGPEGHLVHVGVLILSGDVITYRAPARHSAAEYQMNQTIQACEAMQPSEIFEYFASQGNGVTVDWSEPFQYHAKDLEEIAADLVLRIT